jgi:hypothetical protein
MVLLFFVDLGAVTDAHDEDVRSHEPEEHAPVSRPNAPLTVQRTAEPLDARTLGQFANRWKTVLTRTFIDVGSASKSARASGDKRTWTVMQLS